MRYICEQLLNDITGSDNIACNHEEEYKKLCRYSLHYPDIDIKIEDSIELIEKQWTSIARVIVNECRENQIIPTLFAATKNIMGRYAKVDVEIPRYHVLWLDAVINELESRKDSSFFYFIVFSVFIFYISK